MDIKPYGMGMFCGDLLESANAVIKDMHNNYSVRAGGRGAKMDLPEASLRVVQQCQNRIFFARSCLGGWARQRHKRCMLLKWRMQIVL